MVLPALLLREDIEWAQVGDWSLEGRFPPRFPHILLRCLFHAARELSVGIDECQAAIRSPLFCELTYLVLGDGFRMPQKALGEVLHGSKVASRENVETGQSAKKSELGRPSSYPFDGCQELDRFIVRKGREFFL